MKRGNNIGMVLEHLMSFVRVRSLLYKSILIFHILCSLHQFEALALDNNIAKTEVVSFSYDEIPVLVLVEGYKSFYVDAIYANNDLLYVNIADLFQSLNIPCVMGQKGDSLGGFIENEGRIYSVDYNKGQIKTGTELINAKDGLKKEMGALYLELSLFAEAFGIKLIFNYRALTIILKSDFELPVIKQQRLDKIRNNISKINGEETADTMIERTYHLFRFGMVDWSVASYQTWKGPTDNRLGLGVGAELLHGEADISVNYYSQQKFDNRQLFYLWRWVDNDKKIIKQAQLGKISNQTISFLNAPVIGAVVRNSPTTIRKAKGYYTINEFTEPNWTVELYINNVLIDYTKADASGLFVFKVPMVYGYTMLKLMFYGPMGEERTEERTMNVPYTIMSAKEFEYGISAGVLQDSISSRFGKGEFNYGVNRIFTMGGGLEYLSSIPGAPFIPFAKSTIQPFSKMILTGEYAHGVKAGGSLDYYFWKDALFEIDYTKFKDGQLATRFNALEERKVKLSVPFRIKRITLFSKLDYAQLVYKTFNYNLANVMVSAYYKQVNLSSSTQLNWIDSKQSFVISNLSLAYRPGRGYSIRPSIQYNHREAQFITVKLALEKSIPKGYFTVAYERYPMLNDYYFTVNFKYDLSFARITFNTSRNNNHSYTSESVQGSLGFCGGNHYIYKSTNPSVGKGGIALYPFLDLNQNGVFDKEEHMVKLTSVKILGGRAIFSEKDSIIRISDLNAFTNYILEFNDNNLDNISWRFTNKTYQVLVDPNQFKRVEVPIITVGEVTGMVYMNRDNFMKGIGRISIKFYDKKNRELVAETLSESDGYISYLGLEPGEYVARVDSIQLNNLDYNVNPQQMDFTIIPTEEGDIVENIGFVLIDKKNTPIPQIDILRQVDIQKEVKIIDTDYLSNEDILNLVLQKQFVKDSIAGFTVEPLTGQQDTSTLVWGDFCDQTGMYCIQCGAFRTVNNATRFALNIKQHTDMSVGVILQSGLYKVRIACVPSKREAEKIIKQLKRKINCEDMFVLVRK